MIAPRLLASTKCSKAVSTSTHAPDVPPDAVPPRDEDSPWLQPRPVRTCSCNAVERLRRAHNDPAGEPGQLVQERHRRLGGRRLRCRARGSVASYRGHDVEQQHDD